MHKPIDLKAVAKFLRERYALPAEELELAPQGVMNTNLVFSSGGKKYLFKRNESKTPELVKFEVEVLEHLRGHDFPAPRLIRSVVGAPLELLEERPVLVYEYIEGEPLRMLSEDILHEIGATLGRSHRLLSDFTPSVEKERWDHDTLPVLVRAGEVVMSEKGFHDCGALCAFLLEEFRRYRFPENLPQGVTHQDVKPENIIVRDGRVAGFVDFDNAYVGTLLHDVTTTLIWTCFEEDTFNASYARAFLAGYQKERPLTGEEKEVFADALRWRFLREAFIGPYVTPVFSSLMRERVEKFKRLYALSTTLDLKVF